jgi:hypothetical protein
MIKQKWQDISLMIEEMETDINKSAKNNKSAALRIRKKIKAVQLELKNLRALSLLIGKEEK